MGRTNATAHVEMERLKMVAALTQMTHTLTTDDLKEAGFTSGEIHCLIELRDRYPYLEFTDSLRQWDHLKFMKWRFTNGDLARAEESQVH